MPAWPNVAPPREQTLNDLQKGFAGGLNTTGDAFELRPDQVTRADNARLTQFGSALKRLGTQRVHATTLGSSKPIQGGFCWEKNDGTVVHMVVCNGVFYSGGTSYSIPMTWTSLAVSGGGAALSTTEFVDFCDFVDNTGTEVVYLADGGLILKYDGATLVRVAATPASIRYLELYNQRLFGISGHDTSVYYSALNDGTTLGISGSAGGTAVVRTYGDEKITTIKTLRDSLVLFHTTGISRFTGLTQDDISIATGVQGFSSDVGTLCPRSVTVADGIGYFMSDRGAYRITEDGIAALDTPDKPDPTVALIVAVAVVDFPYMVTVHNRANREIWWAVPGSGVYVFNYRLSAWTGPFNKAYTDNEISSMWETLDNVGGRFVLFGSVDGFVRQADVDQIFLDDVLSDGTGGSSFTFALTCHRMFTSSVENVKSLRWAYVFCDLKGSITASLSWACQTGSNNFTIPNTSPGAIWGDTSTVWNAFIWGGGGASRYRIPLGGRGPYVDFTISDDGMSQSVYSRLELIALDLGPRGS